MKSTLQNLTPNGRAGGETGWTTQRLKRPVFKHTISIILYDTFSCNLFICATCFWPFLFHFLWARKKSSRFSCHICLKRDSQLGSLISCTLKIVHMQGALHYQGDGSNFKLSVSGGNIRDCQSRLWSGAQCNVRLIHSVPFTCQCSSLFSSGW